MTSQALKQKYEIFKLIPRIIAILTMALFFILAIAFAIVFSFGAFLIVMIVGAIFALISYELMTICISPLVITTDAILAYEEKNTVPTNSDKIEKSTIMTAPPAPSSYKRSGKRWICTSCGTFNDEDAIECSNCYSKKQ